MLHISNENNTVQHLNILETRVVHSMTSILTTIGVGTMPAIGVGTIPAIGDRTAPLGIDDPGGLLHPWTTATSP
jgi:hypothetical protein